MADDDKPRQYLAANVRRRRERLGISQDELASRAGVDERYVRRVESAAGVDVRISTLAKLATALECSVGSLLKPAKPVTRRVGRPPSKKR